MDTGNDYQIDCYSERVRNYLRNKAIFGENSKFMTIEGCNETKTEYINEVINHRGTNYDD